MEGAGSQTGFALRAHDSVSELPPCVVKERFVLASF